MTNVQVVMIIHNGRVLIAEHDFIDPRAAEDYARIYKAACGYEVKIYKRQREDVSESVD